MFTGLPGISLRLYSEYPWCFLILGPEPFLRWFSCVRGLKASLYVAFRSCNFFSAFFESWLISCPYVGLLPAYMELLNASFSSVARLISVKTSRWLWLFFVSALLAYCELYSSTVELKLGIKGSIRFISLGWFMRIAEFNFWVLAVPEIIWFDCDYRSKVRYCSIYSFIEFPLGNSSWVSL